MIQQNFIQLYETGFKENWELPALTDYKESTTYSYGELAREIARLHLLFEELDIKQGDKISLIGKNHSSWAILFMATITYGAVIVPILHEFNPESIGDSSETRLAYALYQQIDLATHPQEQIKIPYLKYPPFRFCSPTTPK